MLSVIKTLAIIMSLTFTVILAWFASGQSWAKPEDRPSLIGFSLMAIAYTLDMALIAIYV